MLRYYIILIVVIAIICQFYYINATYSLFNIFYGVILSLFAIISLYRHSPGDHVIATPGIGA